jgi:hypothetical protein
MAPANGQWRFGRLLCIGAVSINLEAAGLVRVLRKSCRRKHA